ncbi:MAG: glycosyltransferase [Ahrensia sp.]|nr:glycosyltransferase [Ahrensia sp.]
MSEDRPRLLFYFLHLLGVGHVHRAQRLIEAFSRSGLAVDVIYGGIPLEGISFDAQNTVYLPPIRAADASYSVMLDADGDPISQDYMDRRRDMLLRAFAKMSPDAILTEAFPFGRRVVRHEILALLEAASKRQRAPLIVSSVRDILQEKRKPGRSEEVRGWIEDHYDRVLVHADSTIIRLDATFPLAQAIARKLFYTGFVVAPTRKNEPEQSFDVVVSAGGGGFGESLMRTAIQLANARPDLTWCLATGPNLPDAIARRLHREAAAHIIVVERLDGLVQHLERAKLSISQCGYNTAMDVLAAHKAGGCRAVFVPHDTTGQTEQLRRAELLQRAGYAVTLPQSRLTLTSLREAANRAMALDAVVHDIDFGGAERSAELLFDWIKERA